MARWPIVWDDETTRRGMSLLPSPLFRHRDVFVVAAKMRLRLTEGEKLWNALVKRGWIVRTGHLIGNAKARYYWTRVSGFEVKS